MRALFFVDYRLSTIKKISTIDYRLSGSCRAIYIGPAAASPRPSGTESPHKRCKAPPPKRCTALKRIAIFYSVMEYKPVTVRRISSIQARTSAKNALSIPCKGQRKNALKCTIKPFPASCIFMYADPKKGYKKTAPEGPCYLIFLIK